jgi:hypothetical protein
VRLPPRALGPVPGAVLAALVVMAIGALLLAAAMALRGRLAVTAGSYPALWGTAVVLAAGLTIGSPDPWRLLLLGLGLAAAVWTPALFATGRAAAVTGSCVGAVVFVALAGLPLVAPGVGGWLETLARYPALVAMPLGWAVVRALGEPAGKPGRAVRPDAR